jgi:DsbC/DsbD-like thiol-disulfide interchange protein
MRSYTRNGWMASLFALTILAPLTAQIPKSDSKVKVTATADKPDADGKQSVTITLDIEPEWHLYANPVENDSFAPVQTRVKFLTKVEDAKVTYPEGKLIKDKTVGDYRTYEGKVVIKATVKRMKSDTGPLEFSIKVQACDKSNCLSPAEVKKSVP